MKSKKKKIVEYDEIIQKHIDNKEIVKFIRNFKRLEDNLFGFIQLMSKNFLLIQVSSEFSLNGYAIVPKKKFESIRFN